jgi:hypothetical protein
MSGGEEPLIGGPIFDLCFAEPVIHGFGCAFSNGVLLELVARRAAPARRRRGSG